MYGKKNPTRYRRPVPIDLSWNARKRDLSTCSSGAYHAGKRPKKYLEVSLEYQLKLPGGYLNVTATQFRTWRDMYPDVDIAQEIDAANTWLLRNPSKGWKTVKGFTKWLDRKSSGTATVKWKDFETEEVTYGSDAVAHDAIINLRKLMGMKV